VAPGTGASASVGASVGAGAASDSLVSVGIVTWNSAADIDACLRAVRAQRHQPIELLVGDNASTDDTRAILERATSAAERIYFDSNLGFAAAHNRLIARSRGEYYLCLNPDAVIEPDYVSALVAALSTTERAGSATGKLLRRDDPRLIDSTGIVMLASQRHLDRDAGERDDERSANEGEVFGASGAAALYRRAMLDATLILGEYFDEDFFSYREDADLAWRAQLLGWRCLYVPDARALHGRRVTPERRGNLPPELNRHSVRNRFLLRIKNQPLEHAVRFLIPALLRDLQVIGYVLLRERTSLPALGDVIRLLPRALRERRAIMAKRVMSSGELVNWFTTDVGAGLQTGPRRPA
jgi:GT2 family glycosyltransferase